MVTGFLALYLKKYEDYNVIVTVDNGISSIKTAKLCTRKKYRFNYYRPSFSSKRKTRKLMP